MMKFMIYAGDYIEGFKPRRKFPAGEVYETSKPEEIGILMNSCIAEPIAPPVAPAAPAPPEPLTEEKRAEARKALEDAPYKKLQEYAGKRGIRKNQKRVVLIEELMEWLK
jgi:hypothetical protein